jgi:hypothetical protein
MLKVGFKKLLVDPDSAVVRLTAGPDQVPGMRGSFED